MYFLSGSVAARDCGRVSLAAKQDKKVFRYACSLQKRGIPDSDEGIRLHAQEKAVGTFRPGA